MSIKHSHPAPALLNFDSLAGYPKPKLSEMELDASLQMPPPATAGGKLEARVGREENESPSKPLAAGGGGDDGFDRSGLKTSGRLRTGILARTEVENVTLCIKQISGVGYSLIQMYMFCHIMQVPNSLAAKQLSVSVFVRDRVTGDTLPVVITSSQPPPVELQQGTTTFDDGTGIPVPNPSSKSELLYAGKVTVALANVPVDENVCCVVEIADASTRSLLAW
jgi:hypothetical protein